MTASSKQTFKRSYQTHLKRLRLKGLQPKTIEAYALASRRIGAYFDYCIEDLSEQELTDYFTDLLGSPRLKPAPRSVQRAKDRIREITQKGRGRNILWVIKEINQFTRGWLGYFRLATVK